LFGWRAVAADLLSQVLLERTTGVECPDLLVEETGGTAALVGEGAAAGRSRVDIGRLEDPTPSKTTFLQYTPIGGGCGASELGGQW
jgi:hypothetical protein